MRVQVDRQQEKCIRALAQTLDTDTDTAASILIEAGLALFVVLGRPTAEGRLEKIHEVAEATPTWGRVILWANQTWGVPDHQETMGHRGE